MRAFTLVCTGQTFSLLGTGMTGFAFVIWAYLQTGQVTTLALAAFARFAPTVVLSPLAGALVDRWNRKLTMMLSDLAAGVATIVLLLLYLPGALQVWHWYVAGAFQGAFDAFQWPAYSAAISTMIPKSQYGRASGMLSVAQSVSGVFSPIFAAALLGIFGVGAGLPVIMGIDIVTFVIAVSILLAVHIPNPAASETGKKARGSLLSESAYGFRYIAARRSLLGLQLVFFLVNFLFPLGFTVLAPMILSRTGNAYVILGIVNSAAAVGGVAGGLALSLWGGPKRRVHGVLGGMALAGVLGSLLMGLGREVAVWSIAAFCSSFILPIINGSNQAIWQAKVAPDVQGKVFAARRLIAQVTAPAAIVIAGPLADRVFEPAMATGGSLAGVLGWAVGTGPGAGMALMLVVFGALGAVVGIGGYSVRAVRDAETILPDHDAGPSTAKDT
jgi:MFS family permease